MIINLCLCVNNNVSGPSALDSRRTFEALEMNISSIPQRFGVPQQSITWETALKELKSTGIKGAECSVLQMGNT